MDFATIQAQIANLTSLVSQYAERTTIQSVPTFGVSYTQEYQADQHLQRGWEDVNTWGYQGHSQSRNNLCSNAYNSDWRDYSDYMWGEPQQFQQGGYWQQEEELYSRPMQPPQPTPQQFQSNLSMPMTCDEILDVLTSLTKGSRQEEYLPPSEEFYQWPYAPSQPPTQSSQTNLGTSMDNDQIVQLLTSLTQEAENQDQRMSKLKNQMGEIMEFMAQIQEQSEHSNSTIENSKEDFEIHETITLGSAMEVGADLKMSKPCQNMDEQLLLEEEEDAKATAREEHPLPQPPKDPTPSNSSKVVPNLILSNLIPPNVSTPYRCMHSKEEECEKGIFETLPKIQEKEVDGEDLAPITEEVFRPTIKEGIGVDHKGQVTTMIVNLAKCKVPETLKEVVFVLEFLSEQASKSSSPISITFYTYILLMIQAPTLEFKPLPDHFKYHPPFKDQFHAVGSNEV